MVCPGPFEVTVTVETAVPGAVTVLTPPAVVTVLVCVTVEPGPPGPVTVLVTVPPGMVRVVGLQVEAPSTGVQEPAEVVTVTETVAAGGQVEPLPPPTGVEAEFQGLHTTEEVPRANKGFALASALN